MHCINPNISVQNLLLPSALLFSVIFRINYSQLTVFPHHFSLFHPLAFALLLHPLPLSDVQFELQLLPSTSPLGPMWKVVVLDSLRGI